MTESQMKETLKTLAAIECKFIASVFTFVKKVEDAAGMPYSVAMIRTWEWLREKGTQEMLLCEDGKAVMADDPSYKRGYKDKCMYVHALDGDVCVSDDRPFHFHDHYGREKVDNHVVFKFEKNMDLLLSDYVSNIGDKPADIAEYKRIGAKYSWVSSGLETYASVILNVMGLALGEDDASDDIGVLKNMLAGKVEMYRLNAMCEKRPKGNPTLAQAFDRQFNVDRDDDND